MSTIWLLLFIIWRGVTGRDWDPQAGLVWVVHNLLHAIILSALHM